MSGGSFSPTPPPAHHPPIIPPNAQLSCSLLTLTPTQIRIGFALGAYLFELLIGVVALAGCVAVYCLAIGWICLFIVQAKLLIATAALLRSCLEEPSHVSQSLHGLQDAAKDMQTQSAGLQQTLVQTEPSQLPQTDVRTLPTAAENTQELNCMPDHSVDLESRLQPSDDAQSQPIDLSKNEMLEVIRSRERDMEERAAVAACDERNATKNDNVTLHDSHTPRNLPDRSLVGSRQESESWPNDDPNLETEAGTVVPDSPRIPSPRPSLVQSTAASTDTPSNAHDTANRSPLDEAVQSLRGPPPAVYRQHKKLAATNAKHTISKEEKKASVQTQWLNDMSSNVSAPPAKLNNALFGSVSRRPTSTTSAPPTQQVATPVSSISRPSPYSAEQLAVRLTIP